MKIYKIAKVWSPLSFELLTGVLVEYVLLSVENVFKAMVVELVFLTVASDFSNSAIPYTSLVAYISKPSA